MIIDVEVFFSEGGQTRPPRMLNFFSRNKVGDLGVNRGKSGFQRGGGGPLGVSLGDLGSKFTEF